MSKNKEELFTIYNNLKDWDIDNLYRISCLKLSAEFECENLSNDEIWELSSILRDLFLKDYENRPISILSDLLVKFYINYDREIKQYNIREILVRL